ncbi:MAG: class I tRNA ligase family protein, partial [Candidatus Magasanikbacteria bacterium]|nr:class I tRNA ligase family protein [Candidatus Magasanikbacteria bacterium]
EFRKDIEELNIIAPDIWCRATDHIKEQIHLIKKLQKRGFAYATSDGIYFDTSKLKDYGKLANLQNQDLRGGARVEVGDKKNITDFALWKFSPKLQKRQMEWSSPWGVGFPGWHIECSAMATKYLGQPFDIHCGGIDHIPVHHTNEIAQSEAANDAPLANYWLHGEFLIIAGDKMAKSGDNFLTLQVLKDKGFSPLAYRYLLMQTNYRKQLNFSWDALQAAQTGLQNFYKELSHIKVRLLNFDKKNPVQMQAKKQAEEEFAKKINDDLDLPGALALLHTLVKTKDAIDFDTILKFDKVLGLKISENAKVVTEKMTEDEKAALPDHIQRIIIMRDTVRSQKDWAKSDQLRQQLEGFGYKVEDTKEGTKVSKN